MRHETKLTQTVPPKRNRKKLNPFDWACLIFLAGVAGYFSAHLIAAYSRGVL
jgi:hypothetical protein